MDKEGNAYDASWFSVVDVPIIQETYSMLQVILNSDFQAGLIARQELGGVYLNISWGVDWTDGVDYVLPRSS